MFFMRYTQTWKKKCYLFLRDILSLSHCQNECVAVIHLANAHDVWIPTCTLACFTAILSRAIYRFRSCMGFPHAWLAILVVNHLIHIFARVDMGVLSAAEAFCSKRGRSPAASKDSLHCPFVTFSIPPSHTSRLPVFTAN